MISVPETYLAIDLIGFTAGLGVSALLLVLTLRASRLPGTPLANTAVALCAVLWNVGGLGCLILMLSGRPPLCPLSTTFMSVQFSAAAVWPLPMLVIWRPLAVLRWQQVAHRLLLTAAAFTGVLITACLWINTLGGTQWVPYHNLKSATSYNGSLILSLGVLLLLRGRNSSRALWLSSLTVLFGALGTSVLMLLADHAWLSRTSVFMTLSQQSVLLIILGSFLLFARFRFADVAIQYSYRILIAGAAATTLVMALESPILRGLADASAHPPVTRFYLATVLAAFFVLSLMVLDRTVGVVLSRFVFQVPDYRDSVRALAARIRRLHVESEILAALRRAVRDTLEVASVDTLAPESLSSPDWPPELAEGEPIELAPCHSLCRALQIDAAEVLVPIRVRGRVHTVLAISPGPARRSLVTQEIRYLRLIADQAASRIDALRQEREEVERQSRETLLLQQVTEAELRALRAQINPHFLFNSLNTLADLIVTNPARAETMTLRLAKVFRHVLTHSSRPLTSIGEEFDFLRAYLHIEEARFGDRLRIDIDVAPEVARENIPSLILQPLVENALKHGLGPKPGPGNLWISARASGDRVLLRVEDDGVGPSATPPPAKSGVGLANIAERLNTLYQDRARITLAARDAGGSCATVEVPRMEGLAVA